MRVGRSILLGLRRLEVWRDGNARRICSVHQKFPFKVASNFFSHWTQFAPQPEFDLCDAPQFLDNPDPCDYIAVRNSLPNHPKDKPVPNVLQSINRSLDFGVDVATHFVGRVLPRWFNSFQEDPHSVDLDASISASHLLGMVSEDKLRISMRECVPVLPKADKGVEGRDFLHPVLVVGVIPRILVPHFPKGPSAIQGEGLTFHYHSKLSAF
mmetsp:Transcript_8227/g.16204  ORF Transcript_8227/g.16204 Transcript_8227/m.16204 type:complete len:211 (-) Transcript_8227:2926-3558(-)